MGRLIGRRLLFLLPVLFGILVAVFVTMRIVPGDPARLVGGPDAGPEELAAIRQQFGLDQPLHVQFERYLLDILRGEFGRSLKTQRPVLDEIVPRLWNTALLAVLSTLFAAALALFLHARSALPDIDVLQSALSTSSLASATFLSPVFF